MQRLSPSVTLFICCLAVAGGIICAIFEGIVFTIEPPRPRQENRMAGTPPGEEFVTRTGVGSRIQSWSQSLGVQPKEFVTKQQIEVIQEMIATIIAVYLVDQAMHQQTCGLSF